MSRLDLRLDTLRAARRTALIPFITAGDPANGDTLEAMRALVRAGADVIELGVPFSDPMADGPVIQRASERALAAGMSLRKVLALVRDFRRQDGETPIVLMGYANPIEAMGVARFVDEAGIAGVDGVLVVDYPPEESEAFAAALAGADMAPIFLLAPTTPQARMDAVARLARGYVYYVSLKGVTGAGHIDVDDVARQLAKIRRRVSLPLGVGFGIRDAATACAVAQHADAVVIGSRLVQEMETGEPAGAPARAEAWLGTIRRALDGRRREQGVSA